MSFPSASPDTIHRIVGPTAFTSHWMADRCLLSNSDRPIYLHSRDSRQFNDLYMTSSEDKLFVPVNIRLEFVHRATHPDGTRFSLFRTRQFNEQHSPLATFTQLLIHHCLSHLFLDSPHPNRSYSNIECITQCSGLVLHLVLWLARTAQCIQWRP